MQFSLVCRKLVEELKRYGPFYQSPYPDYYASNVLMLKAERILVVPKPLVTIGISPKSFGYYYFNDSESDGNELLNNIPDKAMVDRLHKVILPGVAMNTSWLIAMETLFVNFGRELDIKVNYARYRLIQICAIYDGLLTGRSVGKAYRQLRKKMRLGEWLRYGLILTIKARMAKDEERAALSRWLQATADTHPASPMPKLKGTFHTILDVYERVDPDSYLEILE
jgi:hypothetical protein